MQFQLYLVCYTAVFRVNVAQHEINLVYFNCFMPKEVD